MTANASKAYRKAMAKAIWMSVAISCLFGVLVIPIEHYLHGSAMTVGVWILKLILGVATVLVGAEACKECMTRKHDENHPACNTWGAQ